MTEKYTFREDSNPNRALIIEKVVIPSEPEDRNTYPVLKVSKTDGSVQIAEYGYNSAVTDGIDGAEVFRDMMYHNFGYIRGAIEDFTEYLQEFEDTYAIWQETETGYLVCYTTAFLGSKFGLYHPEMDDLKAFYRGDVWYVTIIYTRDTTIVQSSSTAYGTLDKVTSKYIGYLTS